MKRAGALVILFFATGVFLHAGGAKEVTPEQGPDGFSVVTISEITFKWKIDGDRIDIGLSAPTGGWVAVGFNPSSVMKDANLIIGYVKQGETVIEDHFGSGTFSHTNDTELGGTKDISGISGTKTQGTTEIGFSIPLDSGDRYDVQLKPGKKHLVILAFGPDNADNASTKHARRTKIVVTL
jgi:hypothetical protein